MITLHLDVETRSTVELKTAGAHVYFESETTDLWCAAYAFDDGPIDLWTPGEPCPKAIKEHVESGGEIAAWNAQFERLGWWGILTPRYGWPKPKLEQFRCVMVEALAMSLPGALENAAPVVGITEEKDQVGKRIMMQMARPRKIENGVITWWNDSDKLERLYAYCKQDVEVERQIEKRLVRLSPAERQVYLLDQKINDRGINVDIPLCRSALKVVEAATKRLDAEMKAVTDSEVTACGQVGRLIVWLGKNGVDTKSVAKAEIVELLLRPDLPDNARRALEIRQEAAKASTAKIETLLTGMSRDGTAKGLLQYHGASTGRWAGRRFQPQNLPRPLLKKVTDSDIDAVRNADMRWLTMVYGSPLSVVSDCIRSLLVAPEGHDLIAADFSNIEGRVLAWLAGEQWKIRAFEAFDAGIGHDLYKITAGRILGKDPSQITDAERQSTGKVPELALGFEGGVGAFQSMAKVYGVKVPDDQADKIKRQWRDAHPRTTQFWRDLTDAAIGATKAKGVITECGRIRFRRDGSFLWCKLPSGRNLCYPYPRIVDKVWVLDLKTKRKKTMRYPDAAAGEANGQVEIDGEPFPALVYKGVNSYTRQWGDEDFYGGLGTENVVSGTARDVLVAAMIRIEPYGYETLISIHDEAVARVKQGHGSLAEFQELMAVSPSWAKGLPIAASGWRGSRYRKG